ncbi:MAG TPA: baseplate J/gp47 family protein [Thiotrichales bacterium]|nr:baseplate J/gp47 family protein [Thiotrichales bacterium]
MSAITNNLAGLPAPSVIEPLAYDEILAAMLNGFIALYPDYTALVESDPAVKIFEVCAYRELLLRNRINEASNANLLAFAIGSDLDHLAVFYGVTRLSNESDDGLRYRIRDKIMGWSSAGGVAQYRYWAMSASTDIRDVAVDSPQSGVVRISVLAQGNDDICPPDIIDAVKAVVLRDDVKVLTDTVHVVGAELIKTDIVANLWLYPDTPGEALSTIQTALINQLAIHAGLGWDLTQSWIISQLHGLGGVHRVELIKPSQNIRVQANQAVRVLSVNVNFVGRDR